MSRPIPTVKFRSNADKTLGNVLCISNKREEIEKVCAEQTIEFSFSNNISHVKKGLYSDRRPDLILFELNQETVQEFTKLRFFMMDRPELAKIPFVVLSPYPSSKWLNLVKKFKVNDYFLLPLVDMHFRQRLEGLVGYSEKNNYEAEQSQSINWSLPLWKRLMDIAASSILILLLSPVLIGIALLIKLESKGPVIYISKRAGQGFKVFPFLKFRSMRVDADEMIDQLKNNNQYSAESNKTKESLVLKSKPVGSNYTVLIKNDGYVFEEKETNASEESTFFKMKDDPRITRIGRFIRNTSLDELPQLFNVLRGELSLVGNRPLPLYEAEQLTADDYVLRFAAPAGITGLWQVSKRGKENMSEEERKQLDMKYALEYNFWMDVKILWKTLPASIQHESV